MHLMWSKASPKGDVTFKANAQLYQCILHHLYEQCMDSIYIIHVSGYKLY